MTEFKVIETEYLQLFSLMQSFNAIGFSLMRTNRGGMCFVNTNPHRKGRDLISVYNAINMYNNVILLRDVGFDAYEVEQFKAARVVKKCKLQYCKRKKKVKTLNNMVAFVQPAYEALFLHIEEEGGDE